MPIITFLVRNIMDDRSASGDERKWLNLDMHVIRHARPRWHYLAVLMLPNRKLNLHEVFLRLGMKIQRTFAEVAIYARLLVWGSANTIKAIHIV